MAFNLRRISDGAGDSGGMSNAWIYDEEGIKQAVNVGFKPELGCCVQVGSVIARTYSRQDWWMTTPVTQIIEEIKTKDGEYIKFKTGNSVYEWWYGTYPKR